MQELLLIQEVFNLVSDGRKNSTLRKGIREFVPGALVFKMTEDETITTTVIVTEIKHIKYGELTDTEASLEGYSDLEELQEVLHRIYGDFADDEIFTLIEFKLPSLLELNRSLDKLNSWMQEKTREYEKCRNTYSVERKEILERINLLKHSIDIKKFEHGRSLLDIQFPSGVERYSEKWYYKPLYSTLVNDAKKDLAMGAPRLSKEYFGQKYYSGYDQRCDCKYGYSPSHGSIYQSIGLKNPKKALSEYELECCLYLLENLDVLLENLNQIQN